MDDARLCERIGEAWGSFMPLSGLFHRVPRPWTTRHVTRSGAALRADASSLPIGESTARHAARAGRGRRPATGRARCCPESPNQIQILRLAILRHQCHAMQHHGCGPLLRIEPPQYTTTIRAAYVAARRRVHTRQRTHDLPLPMPFQPRDTDNFPAPQRKGNRGPFGFTVNALTSSAMSPAALSRRGGNSFCSLRPTINCARRSSDSPAAGCVVTCCPSVSTDTGSQKRKISSSR